MELSCGVLCCVALKGRKGRGHPFALVAQINGNWRGSHTLDLWSGLSGFAVFRKLHQTGRVGRGGKMKL